MLTRLIIFSNATEARNRFKSGHAELSQAACRKLGNQSNIVWVAVGICGFLLHLVGPWPQRILEGIPKQVDIRFYLTGQPEVDLFGDFILIMWFTVSTSLLCQAISDLLPNFLAGVGDIFAGPYLKLFWALFWALPNEISLKTFMRFVLFILFHKHKMFRLRGTRWLRWRCKRQWSVDLVMKSMFGSEHPIPAAFSYSSNSREQYASLC